MKSTPLLPGFRDGLPLSKYAGKSAAVYRLAGFGISDFIKIEPPVQVIQQLGFASGPGAVVDDPVNRKVLLLSCAGVEIIHPHGGTAKIIGIDDLCLSLRKHENWCGHEHDQRKYVFHKQLKFKIYAMFNFCSEPVIFKHFCVDKQR